MLFADIIGQEHLKKHLTHSVDNGRIPHAQLFVGSEGSGALPMAIAYAQYVLCSNHSGENNTGDSACNLKLSNWLLVRESGPRFSNTFQGELNA